MAVRVRQGSGRRAPAANSAETPSERIVAAANKIEYITTSTGMVLGMRKLGALDEMRITRAVGNDASNAQYYLWCMLAASIAEIDGDQCPMPETTLEFEFIIQRIGDAGVAAIQLHAEAKLAERRAAARRAGKKAPAAGTDESEFADAVKK